MMTPEDGHAKRWEISNKKMMLFMGKNIGKDGNHGKKTLSLWRFSETYWETQLDDFWGEKTKVLELTFHFLSVCARYHYAKR